MGVDGEKPNESILLKVMPKAEIIAGYHSPFGNTSLIVLWQFERK